MIIAVDFDGTLCTFAYPGIGEIEPKHMRVIEALRNWKSQGATIILYTCREDCPERAYLTEAVEWCKKNDIPIDYVNENCPESQQHLPKGFASRKVCADLYIDDRAMNPFKEDKNVLDSSE